jgi:exopolyphosphatase/guanosine-5'-triphosphate,3'-diphosphate pyrophosphatase
MIENPGADSLVVPADSAGLLAAVDLGSNSFQVLIASYDHGQLKVIDRLREMVRLAAGLDASQQLDAASQKRALECLARFGERLRDIPPENMRAVGTNTLRKARNPAEFLASAEALLGHEIDIISGIEEARLIYVGVSRTMPAIDGEQLVIDIGGGSTELAAGHAFQPRTLESLHMGCVGMSRACFPGGEITSRNFRAARTAARLELRPVVQRFRRIEWLRAAGASGTIRSASNVLLELGLTKQHITVPSLEKLIQIMVEAGHVDNLSIPALSEQRAPVFPGGIAVLIETMQELEIAELAVTHGALREGILFDLVGRSSEQDARLRTVGAMESRYHVDADQAGRVELTAVSLFDQVAADWKLAAPDARQLLAWAARLHEIGLDIAHSNYHRHSAYLLEHSDMSGFDRNEQKMLALLVRAHRRGLPVDYIEAALSRGSAKRIVRLAVLLRLAVLFNRSRTYEFPNLLKIDASGKSVSLALPEEWLAENPLTQADLEREQDYLSASGYELEFVTA